MIDAGVVLETDQSKLAGKRHAQLYRYALDHYDFNFPRILEYPRELKLNKIYLTGLYG